MLNVYHLRYFADAARLGSLSAASDKNRVGRSAVSQAIRSLERSLGTELLEHRKNAFELTPGGQALLRHCDEVFGAIERVQDEVQEAKSGLSGELRIATSHSIGISLLPRVLSRFSKKHPRIQLSLQLGNADRMKELLTERAVDLAVAVAEPGEDFGSFERTLLRRGHYRLMQGPQKPEQERYLIGDKGIEVNRFKQGYLKTEAGRKAIWMSIQSWEVAAALARQGYGYALLPDFMQLAPVRGKAPIHPYQLFGFLRRGQRRSKAIESLLSQFKTEE